jgi:hypothetical protein
MAGFCSDKNPTEVFLCGRPDRITAVTEARRSFNVVRCMATMDTRYIDCITWQRLCSVERKNFVGLSDELERTLGTRLRSKSRYYAGIRFL